MVIEYAQAAQDALRASAVEGGRFEDLKEGQRVSFTEGQGPKGPRAEKVKPI